MFAIILLVVGVILMGGSPDDSIVFPLFGLILFLLGAIGAIGSARNGR